MSETGGDFSRGGGYRGSGGERGGRGGGGRRGQRGSRGGGKWNQSRAPVVASSNPSVDSVPKPAEEIKEFWTNASAQPTAPPPPLVFEPPLTDYHLKTAALMKELRDSRSLTKDDYGVPIVDCRGFHGFDRMCQFCDGRRGPWVQENSKTNDKAFLRYQNSIISPPMVNQSSKDDEDTERNVLKLVPEPIEYDEEEFGMLDKKLNICE